MPRFRARHVAVLLFYWLAGCTPIGPQLTRDLSVAYNDAVQASGQRELMLNIVRLRYTDTPEFLSVSSISTEMHVERGLVVGADIGKVEGATTHVGTASASFGYSESPIVTFTPRTDEKFTRQLVAPVSLDSLYLLIRYGWSIERVLLLTAEEINGLHNVTSREDLSSDRSSEQREFTELCSVLRRLAEDRMLELEQYTTGEIVSESIPVGSLAASDLLQAETEGYRFALHGEPARLALSRAVTRYRMMLRPEAGTTPESIILRRLANLGEDQTQFPLESSSTQAIGPGRFLRIETRSVLGVLAYLSHGVTVPLAHLEQGLANSESGGRELVARLLEVRSSPTRPESAWLAVPYRDQWFYIDQADLNSRRTLGLLNSLMRLEIDAGGSQNVPILTLPLGR
jgi:hypothetical protein